MKTILAAIVLAFLHLNLWAEPRQAIYSVTNVLDTNKNRLEIWSYHIPKDIKIDHELTKEPFNTRGTPFEKQVQGDWFKEIHQAGQPTYFKERLTEDPARMRNGRRSYGYIEERDNKTDEVVNSFPVFYDIAGMNIWRRATFKIYLPGGIEEVVTRDFHRGLYHFPFLETRIVSQHGIVVSHLIYKYEK